MILLSRSNSFTLIDRVAVLRSERRYRLVLNPCPPLDAVRIILHCTAPMVEQLSGDSSFWKSIKPNSERSYLTPDGLGPTTSPSRWLEAEC
jgi:hypothetical protein